MHLRNLLFSLEGRISRRQYCVVVSGIIILCVGISLAIIAMSDHNVGSRTTRTLYFFTPDSVLAWMLFATSVKRWHDMDHSGAMMFLWLIPFIGALIVLFWLLTGRGISGRNQYGENPSGLRLLKSGRRHAR